MRQYFPVSHSVQRSVQNMNEVVTSRLLSRIRHRDRLRRCRLSRIHQVAPESGKAMSTCLRQHLRVMQNGNLQATAAYCNGAAVLYN